MSTPKVSVIVPCYNQGKYAKECLDSVMAQTFQDFEVICVNDGSPDNCLKILEEFSQNDNRIRVYTQENQGQSAARNKGLDNAKGEYIFFLDSDDLLPDFSLQTLLQIAQKTNVPLVASKRLGTQELPEEKLTYQVHRNVLKDFVRDRRIFSTPCNKLYRADILKTHRFISGIYFEDWPFLTTLFGQIDSYATTDIACYTYNEENSSTTRSDFSQKKVDSYLTGIRYVYDFYKNRPDLSLAQKRIAVAVKMMVNKVYKAKDKELIHYTLTQLNDLFQKGIVKKYGLPLKTLFRLWKMRHMK